MVSLLALLLSLTQLRYFNVMKTNRLSFLLFFTVLFCSLLALPSFIFSESRTGYDGAGNYIQGNYAVAIGDLAGQQNQPANAIAIGSKAGLADTQDAASIILNASGSGLGDNAETGLFIKPVRYAPNTNGRLMMYDTITSEITLQNRLIIFL